MTSILSSPFSSKSPSPSPHMHHKPYKISSPFSRSLPLLQYTFLHSPTKVSSPSILPLFLHPLKHPITLHPLINPLNLLCFDKSPNTNSFTCFVKTLKPQWQLRHQIKVQFRVIFLGGLRRSQISDIIFYLSLRQGRVPHVVNEYAHGWFEVVSAWASYCSGIRDREQR